MKISRICRPISSRCVDQIVKFSRFFWFDQMKWINIPMSKCHWIVSLSAVLSLLFSQLLKHYMRTWINIQDRLLAVMTECCQVSIIMERKQFANLVLGHKFYFSFSKSLNFQMSKTVAEFKDADRSDRKSMRNVTPRKLALEKRLEWNFYGLYIFVIRILIVPFSLVRLCYMYSEIRSQKQETSIKVEVGKMMKVLWWFSARKTWKNCAIRWAKWKVKWNGFKIAWRNDENVDICPTTACFNNFVFSFYITVKKIGFVL